MKKLSAVQLKLQAAVMGAVTALEQQALTQLPGTVQCWFSLAYDAFPGSLLVRVQFADEAALALAQPQLDLWQKQLSGLLLKKGIVLKDRRRHLVFTLSGPED